MANLGVKFGNIDFKNPVVMASGTFGFGKEYNEIYDIQKLGGISSKGLTLEKRDGNKGMRVWETPSGMMNSVGLENPSVQGFIDNELKFFKGLNLVRIANLGGGTLDDYVKGAELLNNQSIDMIELNISCPNVKAGGMVHEVCKNVSIPVMGMGGITTAQDAIEFIMAGATCIQVGTANFINPKIGIEIIDGIEEFMKKEGIKSLDEIRGII